MRPTWCGARRTCGSRTLHCSATCAGSGFSRSAAGRRPVRGTWLGRARPWSPSTCLPGCWPHAVAAAGRTGTSVPLVQADVCEMPFADASFDLAFSAFGAIPFVADSAGAMREVARVLRPGGRWVFAATHPMRWAFPDDPGPLGLTAIQSYFDRSPYVEVDEQGVPAYVEHHRTMGDRIREIVAAGLMPAGCDRTGVAGGLHRRLGTVVRRARRDVPRHRDLRHPAARLTGRPTDSSCPAGLPTWSGIRGPAG